MEMKPVPPLALSIALPSPSKMPEKAGICAIVPKLLIVLARA